MARLDGIGLGAVAIGSLFAYAGLKGYSVPHAVQALITGHAPATGGNAHPITTPTETATGAAGSGVGINAQIAANFMQYAGKVPYVWGQANPKGWDCSGSCNYVICHDTGMDIPGFKGGAFTGAQHGPSTFTWLAWAGNMTRLSKDELQAGDLVLWQTHMGVVTGTMDPHGAGPEYVSAYDTQDGTVVKPIHGGGPWGEVATYWRLR